MKEARRRELADCYLDHLLIALKARDEGAPFRTFLDNWYAYEVGGGHLTRGGRPIWFNNPCARSHGGALSAMHFRSKPAARVLTLALNDPFQYRQLRDRKDASVRLMVDHAVPLRVIISTLMKSGPLDREQVRGILNDSYRLGVITADEDARLRSAGLVSSMPNPWNGDPFARYAHVGIVISEEAA